MRVIVNLYRKEEKKNVGELVFGGEDFNFEMGVGVSEAGWDRNVRVEGFPMCRALVVEVEGGVEVVVDGFGIRMRIVGDATRVIGS